MFRLHDCNECELNSLSSHIWEKLSADIWCQQGCDENLLADDSVLWLLAQALLVVDHMLWTMTDKSKCTVMTSVFRNYGSKPITTSRQTSQRPHLDPCRWLKICLEIFEMCCWQWVTKGKKITFSCHTVSPSESSCLLYGELVVTVFALTVVTQSFILFTARVEDHQK